MAEEKPNGTFSDFSLTNTAASLKKGAVHPTLGVNLKGDLTWWEHGARQFDFINELYPVRPATKVWNCFGLPGPDGPGR